MNVGVCVQYHCGKDIDASFKNIVDYGIKECQLVCWDMNAFGDDKAAEINAAKEKYGVTVTAFWCGWEGPVVWDLFEGQKTLGLVPVEYREQRIKNLCDGADFAKKIGVDHVVTHMGFIPENPYDPVYPGFIETVKTIATHLKANGQYLLFETGQETPVTLMRAFEDSGMDNLGVNIDTANVILYGKANPVDALDVIGKYVMGVHAKDGLYPTNGHDLGEEVALGEGKANFKEFLPKLHALGYDGPITIEREITGEQQAIDILKAKALIDDIIATF